jgi:hypothetical protein
MSRNCLPSAGGRGNGDVGGFSYHARRKFDAFKSRNIDAYGLKAFS